MTSTFSARLGLLCAAAAALACTGAHAQEGVTAKNILGSMGLISPEKDPIRYRERAPLVLPPKLELRAPAGAESYASNNPQWPNDPDVAARRRRAAEERIPVTESEVRRMSSNNPTLTPGEMRSGRDPNGPGPGRHKSDRDGVWISPLELAATRKPESEDLAGAAPVRRTLTDPPSALRKSARGGEVQRDFQPKVDQQQQDANPMNWLTRAFRPNEDE